MNRNLFIFALFAVSALFASTNTAQAGGGYGYQNCNYQTNVNCPEVNLVLNKINFIEGENIKLSWSSTGADSCDVSWAYGRHSTSGVITRTARLWDRYVYAQCYKKVGHKTYYKKAYKYINVTTLDTPILEFTVNGNKSVDYRVNRGAQVKLQWNTTGANRCESSWTGPGAFLPLHGVMYFNAMNTKSYHIVCYRGSARIQKNITVHVKQPPVAKINYFKADKTLIQKGKSVRISWNTQNAVSCKGSWSGVSLPSSGSAVVTPNLLGSNFYYLYCKNVTGLQTTASLAIDTRPADTEKQRQIHILEQEKAMYENLANFWRSHGSTYFANFWQSKADAVQDKINALK